MTTLVEQKVQTEPTRRPINVYEYHAMGEAGILGMEERVELIDGEIITMSPIGPEHGASVDAGTYFLVSLIGLKWRDDFYRHQLPGPDDVLLIVEVSDSSLSYDRNRKLGLYARFGVPEVWIANIPARVVEVYRDPVDGEYTITRVYQPGEMVSPLAFEDVEVSVSQFIGAVSDDREDHPASG